jgi:hypothetical protein
LAKKAKFFKKSQKKAIKAKFAQKAKIIQNLAFCQIFGFFGTKLFWKFLYFLEKIVFFGTSLLFVISEAT